ncbi:leukocyte immunoglobulin-like receptor subfamily A member 3 [Phascolarctos cinereus]
MSPTFISLLYVGLSLGQAVEVPNGSLSKPHLQALPAPVVAPGGDVTLQCSMSPHSYLKAMTFILQKGQNMEPLQTKPGEGTKVDFCLFFLRPQDTGNYSCIYRETTDSYRVSEPSEPVELWVTDILPKTFLSAKPSQLVVSGGNVTLLCWGPIQGVRFALYKEGEKSFVSIRESTKDRAEFPLTHVNITNMGNYSCCYYLGPDSHVLALPSDLLELTVQSEQDILSQHTAKTQVSRYIMIALCHIGILFLLFLLLAFLGHQHTQTGSLPKPFLSALPGPVVAPGGELILWCRRPSESFDWLVTFSLLKSGTQEPLQKKDLVYSQAKFSLKSLGVQDSGNYRCIYYETSSPHVKSEPSDVLEIWVTGLSLGQAMEVRNGSLSKPHLQALPAPVVAPGGDVTLQCSMPPHSYLKAMTFILQKGQNMEPLRIKPGEGMKVDFCLFSLRPQDTGNYSCIYRETTGFYRVSEPSDTLELWVTDILPKPFLSVKPSQLVVSGGNVTFLCWGQIQGVKFALYKEGEESFVSIRESTQGGAEFHLSHVNVTNTGNYSCCYYLGPDSHVLAPPSDPLELKVQGEQGIPSQHTASRNLLIILSCISILFLLLVAFLVHQHTQTVTSHGQIPRRLPDCLCLSQHCSSYNPGSPQEESAYTQTNEWRQRGMTVPEGEDSQEITYIQLNKGIFSEAQIVFPSKPLLEPIVYATVAMHCGAERDHP